MHSFRCHSLSNQVSQTEAPVCSQQKETVFVLGCSSGAPRTESTVLWPHSKMDHLSPEVGLATPAFTAVGRQKGTCRVDVAQQASRIKPPPISISTHPPLCHIPAACCLPSYLHTNDSLSAACTLRKGEKENKEEERNVDKGALISQKR